MMTTSALSLYCARQTPYCKQIDDYLFRIFAIVGVAFILVECDSASGNKRYLAAVRQGWKANKRVVIWWQWCAQHLHHAIQATLFTVDQGPDSFLTIVSSLYSGSLLCRQGATWHYLVSAVADIAGNATIRPWPPPDFASKYKRVVISLISMGFGKLGETNEALIKSFMDMFDDLNGDVLEDGSFIHYCKGIDCCPQGRLSFIARLRLHLCTTLYRTSKGFRPVSAFRAFRDSRRGVVRGGGAGVIEANVFEQM